VVANALFANFYANYGAEQLDKENLPSSAANALAKRRHKSKNKYKNKNLTLQKHRKQFYSDIYTDN